MEVPEDCVADSSKSNSNRRKKWRAKKKLMKTNESQIMDQMCSDVEASEKIGDSKSVPNDLVGNPCETNLTLQQLVECPKTVTESLENLPKVKTDAKQKKKRKRTKRKVKSKDEAIGVDQNMMDTGSTGNLAEEKVNGKRKSRRKKKKAVIKDEVQSTDQIDNLLNLQVSEGQETEGKLIESEHKAQESESSTRKESPLSDLVPDKENLSYLCKVEKTVELSNVGASSNKISSEVGGVRYEPSPEAVEVERKFVPLEVQHRPSTCLMDGENETFKSGINEVNVVCTTRESDPTMEDSSLPDLVPDEENLLDSCRDQETVNLSHAVEDSSNRICSVLGAIRSGPLLEPMEMEEKFIPSEIQHRPKSNLIEGENETFKSGINEVNNEIVVDEGENCSAEGGNNFCCREGKVTISLSPAVIEAECLSNDLGHPRITAPIACNKRKLLVLDVNGLLAHIVMPVPRDRTADAYILGRAIFKRPFCDDFLKFCFDNFDVGVWSSRSKKIIDRVVSCLLGHMKDKLKFCWDMDHSTQTGFQTLENRHKPLVCKELRKIWENDESNLPWRKGDYNESNTILLDDSPYKALLNPLHTAIFPNSYNYEDENDNSLGPDGDLRVYLEGLLTCENAQKYVEQHPFGQSAINESDISWGFYSGILQTMSSQLSDNSSSAIPPLSSL